MKKILLVLLLLPTLCIGQENKSVQTYQAVKSALGVYSDPSGDIEYIEINNDAHIPVIFNLTNFTVKILAEKEITLIVYNVKDPLPIDYFNVWELNAYDELTGESVRILDFMPKNKGVNSLYLFYPEYVIRYDLENF